jgi:glycerol-3-phosphate dehydrogenase (NAD(P)+)
VASLGGADSEGVASAPAVRALMDRMKVDMPISAAVAAILAGEVGVDEAILGLLSRPLRAET